MKYLLYLSPTERQLWGNDGKGWQRVTGESKAGYAWVVTDLAEESFAEAKTPRLIGRDRSAFVERLLASRYPETPYRSSMTPSQEGDLVSKMLPTRHILFGIDAAERLDAELDATSLPIAGVWPASMLLSLLGQDKALPADLLVVMPGPGTLRIVFLKNRTPVLTRLTLTPNEAAAQVDEIIRTLRHLENTQILKRDRQAHPVLLLGDPAAFDAPMAAANLKLVSLPAWERQPPEDWRFPLFDLALRTPAGQLAPLEHRVDYLAARLGKAARVLTVVLLVVAAAAASKNLLSIFSMINESSKVDASIELAQTRLAETDLNIARFGVVPETVRRAVALNADEIASAPAMDQHLRLIAGVLAVDPNLRLLDLQWRLLTPGTLPCSAVATSSEADAKPPGSESRKVELSFELAVPATYGPRDRAQTLRSVSGQLTGIDGITIWQDANRDIASGSLTGGTLLSTATRLLWCVTLPGTVSAPETRPGTSKS